ncbi:lysine permease [Pestalotiopsis sp. IQ-011]
MPRLGRPSSRSNESPRSPSTLATSPQSPTTPQPLVTKGKRRFSRSTSRWRSKTVGDDSVESSPPVPEIPAKYREQNVQEVTARATRQRQELGNTPIQVHSRLSAIMDNEMPKSHQVTVSLRVSELPRNIIISTAVQKMIKEQPDRVVTFNIQFHPGLNVNLDNVAETIRTGQAMLATKGITDDMVQEVEPVKAVRFSEEDKVFPVSPLGSMTSILDDYVVSDLEDDDPADPANADEDDGRNQEPDTAFCDNETGEAASQWESPPKDSPPKFVLPNFDFEQDADEFSSIFEDNAERPATPITDEQLNSPWVPSPMPVTPKNEINNAALDVPANIEQPIASTAIDDADVVSHTEATEHTEAYIQPSASSASEDDANVNNEQSIHVADAQNLPAIDEEDAASDDQNEISVHRESSVVVDEQDSIFTEETTMSVTSKPDAVVSGEQNDSVADVQVDTATCAFSRTSSQDTVLAIPNNQHDAVIGDKSDSAGSDRSSTSADAVDIIGLYEHSDTASDRQDTISDEQNDAATLQQAIAATNAIGVPHTDEYSDNDADDEHEDAASDVSDITVVGYNPEDGSDGEDVTPQAIQQPGDAVDSEEQPSPVREVLNTADHVADRLDKDYDDDCDISSILSMLNKPCYSSEAHDESAYGADHVRPESPTVDVSHREVIESPPPPMPPRPRSRTRSFRQANLPPYTAPTPPPRYELPPLPRGAIYDVDIPAPLRLRSRPEQESHEAMRTLPVRPSASRIPMPGVSSRMARSYSTAPPVPPRHPARSQSRQRRGSSASLHPRTFFQEPHPGSRYPNVPFPELPLRSAMPSSDKVVTSAAQPAPASLPSGRISPDLISQNSSASSRIEVTTEITVTSDSVQPETNASAPDLRRHSSVRHIACRPFEHIPAEHIPMRHIPASRLMQPSPEPVQPKSRLAKLNTRSMSSLFKRKSNKSRDSLDDASTGISDQPPMPFIQWKHSSEAAELGEDLARGYNRVTAPAHQRLPPPMPVLPSIGTRKSSIGATAAKGPAALTSGLRSLRVPRRPRGAASSPAGLSFVEEGEEPSPLRTNSRSDHKRRGGLATPRAVSSPLDRGSSPLGSQLGGPTPSRRRPTVRKSSDTISTVTRVLPCGHTEVQHRSLDDEELFLRCGIVRSGSASTSNRALPPPRQFFADGGLAARGSSPAGPVSTQAFLFPEDAEAHEPTVPAPAVSPETPDGSRVRGRVRPARAEDPFTGVPSRSNLLYSTTAGGPRVFVEDRARERGGPFDEEIELLGPAEAASTPMRAAAPSCGGGGRPGQTPLRPSRSLSSMLSRFRRGR